MRFVVLWLAQMLHLPPLWRWGAQGLQWPVYHWLSFAYCQTPTLGSGHLGTGQCVHWSHFDHVILLAVVTLDGSDHAERYKSPLQAVVGHVHTVHVYRHVEPN
jgi:hypothetical protein